MAFLGESEQSELSSSRPKDHFLLYPPLQPKREIGEYVAAHGILVPRRYANYDEALTSGRPFIIRSEHPQEYAGVSGLLESYSIIPDDLVDRAKGDIVKEIPWDNKGRRDLEDRVLAQIGTIPPEQFEENLRRLSQENIDRFVSLTGKNLSQISYSLWEKLGGINSSIIADSAVPDKYHIFSRDPDVPNRNWYSLVLDGEVMSNQHSQIGSDLGELIDLYKSVRNLDQFDPNHCPIIEAQSVDGKHYFLQYHRTRDFEEATHILERVMEPQEMRAVFVRGATPPDGIEVDINLYFLSSGNFQRPLPPEGGAMGWNGDFVYSELMRRKRQLEIFNVDNPVAGISNGGYHYTESQLFKPAMSIGVDSSTYTDLLQGVEPSGEHGLGKIKVHCVSDGTNAYLKRVA